MTPIGARLILRKDVSPEASPGGIFMPDKSREQSRRGTVLAVGPGCTQVKVGDVVITSTKTTAIQVDGEELHLTLEDNVFYVE